MSTKQRESRRARNRQIAEQDHAGRCTFCRRTLPRIGVLLLLTPSGKSLRYCNAGCRQDHADKLFTLEARR